MKERGPRPGQTLGVSNTALRSLLAASILLAACAPESATTPVTVRDSAGVEIVESTAPMWDPGEEWVVAADPILDLADTGRGAAHEFYRVADARRLVDGRIAVALQTEVRLYSDSGAHERTIGREGDGPGEFRRITSLGMLPPDSLVVYDRRRITVLDSEPNAWDVFSADGAWLGRVHTPGRFRVLEIGSDYMLGVRKDDLDVEHVQVLALTR